MNKNRRMLTRATSVALTVAMGLSMVACGATTASEETTVEVEENAAKEEAEKLETALNESSFGQSDDADTKMETVYVTADASGTTQNIIVSDWLRNYDGADTLIDQTDLTDIQNVKGDETYTENSDGTISWAADGNDIYYQGSTSKSLPVSVKVSYKLDGKDITAEELAGKSGKVTIRFDYTNTAKATVKVGDKNEQITVPFAMVSGMILPTDKFTNVTVTNGKVISDASSNIVMGVALPGLKEALNLNEDKLEELQDEAGTDLSIPEYVEVTADVEDFELGMTMTLASADVLKDLGFDDLDNSDAISQISDSMDLLSDSMQQLTDGSAELYEGAKKLSDGASSLKSGVTDYTNGVGQLTAGAKTLNDSMGSLSAGTQALADGTEQLKTALNSADINSLTSLLTQYTAIHNALNSGSFLSDYKGAQALAGLKADGTLANVQTQAAQLTQQYKDIQTKASATTNDVIGAKVYASAVQSVMTATSTDEATATNITALALQMSATQAQATEVTPSMLTDEAFTTNVATVASVSTVNSKMDTLIQNASAKASTLSTFTAFLNNKYGELNATEDEVAFGLYLASQNSVSITSLAEMETALTGGYLTAAKTQIQAYTAAKNAQPSADTQKSQLGSYIYETAVSVVKNTAATNGSSIDDATAELVTRYGLSQASSFDTQSLMTALTNASTELATIQSQKAQLEAATSSLRTVDQAKAIKATRGWESVTDASSLSESNQTWLGLTGMTYDEWQYISAFSVCSDTDYNTAAEYIAKYTAFETKYNLLTTTASSLTTSIGALKTGVDQLDAGADSLNSAVKNQLVPGVLALYNGASLLDSNSATLLDGATQLADGAKTLADGTKTLDDGLVKFDEEGISKLVEAFDGDISEFSDRLQAVSDAADAYESFSGVSDLMTSNVKFIIETGAVDADMAADAE